MSTSAFLLAGQWGWWAEAAAPDADGVRDAGAAAAAVDPEMGPGVELGSGVDRAGGRAVH